MGERIRSTPKGAGWDCVTLACAGTELDAPEVQAISKSVVVAMLAEWERAVSQGATLDHLIDRGGCMIATSLLAAYEVGREKATSE